MESAPAIHSQRLLDLLQILRRHRYSGGHVLAGELESACAHPLYRDIAKSLRRQGAHPGRRRRQALLREWRERESIAAQ